MIKKYRDQILGISCILLIIFFSTLFNRRNKIKMENTIITEAFYIDNVHIKNNGPISSYYYSVENKRYENGFYDTDKFLQKGDTILIKYSKEDPSLSEVVDKYYMQKYKHLKNQ